VLVETPPVGANGCSPLQEVGWTAGEQPFAPTSVYPPHAGR